MARARRLGSVDTKLRHSADKARGMGRRNARQTAARRTEVVESQAAADPAVATPAIARGVDVEDGQSCRDAREDGAPRPAVTTASASRAKVDAAAIDEGRVPSSTGTSHRKAKRAASGTSRVSASRVSTRGEGSGAAGTQRKPPLSGRASTSKKSSGVSRTARKR